VLSKQTGKGAIYLRSSGIKLLALGAVLLAGGLAVIGGYVAKEVTRNGFSNLPSPPPPQQALMGDVAYAHPVPSPSPVTTSTNPTENITPSTE